eukprot:FR736433.1.p1 GENE.FR736433.1~~FR736433.1.p1  ORF type:complete len:151 (+),score=11.43 FR736433.1:449-901(+)
MDQHQGPETQIALPDSLPHRAAKSVELALDEPSNVCPSGEEWLRTRPFASWVLGARCRKTFQGWKPKNPNKARRFAQFVRLRQLRAKPLDAMNKPKNPAFPKSKVGHELQKNAGVWATFGHKDGESPKVRRGGPGGATWPPLGNFRRRWV